jgi:hypothetical protein
MLTIVTVIRLSQPLLVPKNSLLPRGHTCCLLTVLSNLCVLRTEGIVRTRHSVRMFHSQKSIKRISVKFATRGSTLKFVELI